MSAPSVDEEVDVEPAAARKVARRWRCCRCPPRSRRGSPAPGRHSPGSASPARLRTRRPRPGAAARRRASPSGHSRAGRPPAARAVLERLAGAAVGAPRRVGELVLHQLDLVRQARPPGRRAPGPRASRDPGSARRDSLAGEPFRRTRVAVPRAIAHGLPSLCGRPSSPSEMRLQSRAPPCFFTRVRWIIARPPTRPAQQRCQASDGRTPRRVDEPECGEMQHGGFTFDEGCGITIRILAVGAALPGRTLFSYRT